MDDKLIYIQNDNIFKILKIKIIGSNVWILIVCANLMKIPKVLNEHMKYFVNFEYCTTTSIFFLKSSRTKCLNN